MSDVRIISGPLERTVALQRDCPTGRYEAASNACTASADGGLNFRASWPAITPSCDRAAACIALQSYSPARELQRVGRIRRIGTSHSELVHAIVRPDVGHEAQGIGMTSSRAKDRVRHKQQNLVLAASQQLMNSAGYVTAGSRKIAILARVSQSVATRRTKELVRDGRLERMKYPPLSRHAHAKPLLTI